MAIGVVNGPEDGMLVVMDRLHVVLVIELMIELGVRVVVSLVLIIAMAVTVVVILLAILLTVLFAVAVGVSVAVSMVESVMNGVLMEMNGLNIMLIIESMVKFGVRVVIPLVLIAVASMVFAAVVATIVG